MKITKKNERPTFARNVVLRRFELSITGEQLAERANVPYPTLAKIEAGISGGNPRTKEKIAKALGMTVDDLNTPSKAQSEAKDYEGKADLLGAIVMRLSFLDEDQLRAVLNTVEGLEVARSSTSTAKRL